MDMRVTPKTLGEQIDELDDLRKKKQAAAKVLDELEGQYNELAEQLLQRLQADKATKASGTKATISVGEVVVANVAAENRELAWKLISKNPHLMQFRISDPAFREMLALKGEKYMARYGFTPFVKVKLNHTSLKAK